MKFFLIGLFTLFGSGVAYADYAAIAAGPKGSGYVEGYETSEGARAAAVQLCRTRWNTSCSVVTAADSSWYFAAALCDNEPYTAASPQSSDRAATLIYIKAAADGRQNCRIFANH